MSEKAARAAIKLRSVPVTMDLAKGKNSSEIAKAAHFTEERFLWGKRQEERSFVREGSP